MIHSTGEKWQAHSQAAQMPHSATFGRLINEERFESNIEDVMRKRLGNTRVRVFRYLLIVHALGNGENALGVSPTPGQYSMVAMGAKSDGYKPGIVDWNCDLSYEGLIPPTSINGNAESEETLTSHNDWGALQFKTGAIGDMALGVALNNESELKIIEVADESDSANMRLSDYSIAMTRPSFQPRNRS